MIPVRMSYPRVPKLAPLKYLRPTSVPGPRYSTTQPRNSYYTDRIRQRIIQEINSNPNFLSQSTVTYKSRRFYWLRRVLFLASSYCVCMGLYLAHNIYNVYKLDASDCEAKSVFIPVWFGANWPTQKRLSFPKYLHHLVQDQSTDFACEPGYKDKLQKEHVERQVLDCLFRLTLVRETFKLPISVVANPKDAFELWIEPHYPTLHGPMLSVYKKNGKLCVDSKWRLKLIRGTRDVGDFFSGFLLAFESLVATGAQRNTHDKASGRIHQANQKNESNLSSLDTSQAKSQVYNIAFRGVLDVSDISKQHIGTVSYTGLIDNAHMGLHGGVRIQTMTLEVAEYGKSSTLYKVK